MNDPATGNSLLLSGLDGSNPLAFLAALGGLRLLSDLSPMPKMSWRANAGAWRPVLHGSVKFTNGCELLHELTVRLNRDPKRHPAKRWSKYLDDDHARIRRLVADNLDEWSACIGIEPLMNTDLSKRFSKLQTARKDYQVKALNNLTDRSFTENELRRTLLEPWDYADPLVGMTLHLDPSEDRRHAYQWTKPEGDPSRKREGTMFGANRLAVEALPLFPSVHDADAAQTVGFRGDGVHNTFWTWPIWTEPANVDVIRSLLSLEELQQGHPNTHRLRAIGLVAVYRSQRILVGKTPNLTPAQSVLC